jgi:hypothetical protein
MQELFLLSRSPRAKSMVKDETGASKTKKNVYVDKTLNKQSLYSETHCKEKQSARSSQEIRIPKTTAAKRNTPFFTNKITTKILQQ